MSVSHYNWYEFVTYFLIYNQILDHFSCNFFGFPFTYYYFLLVFFFSNRKILTNRMFFLLLKFLGSEDNFCRLDSVVRSTEYCDNYIVKIIENAGHWPHQEMPVEFNRVILKFLVGKMINDGYLIHISFCF